MIVLKSSKHISCNSLPFGEVIEAGGGVCVSVRARVWGSPMFGFIYHALMYRHSGKKSEL